MRKVLVPLFVLVLTVAWTQVFYFYQFIFIGVDDVKEKNKILTYYLQEQKLKQMVTDYRFQEYRSYVAQYAPTLFNKVESREKSYPVRRIASVPVYQNAELLTKFSANRLMEMAKEEFREQKYEKADSYLEQIISDYSYSPHVIEAHFLYVESLFQQNKLEKCTQSISKMVGLFPESELTGYALLRLGRVLEIQERQEEASEIYRTVLQSFENPELKQQSRLALRTMSL